MSAYLLAVLLPVATAAAMIPLRAEHGRTTAIVLVVPVVVVAAFGATGPAVVAAFVTAVAYDFLLTEPHYRLAIDDPDNVVAAVTLGVVALIVGVLSSRLVHLSARNVARGRELHHLVEFAKATVAPDSPDTLADEACRRITAVLDLRECQWRPGHHEVGVPLLLPDGNVMGHLVSLNLDRAKLPAVIEMPAEAGARELGRFVLTCDPDRITSFEERLTAATIASLYAATVERLARPHRP